MKSRLGLLAFLWGYFRRYWIELVLATAVVLIFSISSILLVALFQPILEEVLLSDAGAVQWDPLESTCRHASLSIL